MRTRRPAPGAATRIGRTIHRACCFLSASLLGLGLVVFLLAQMRNQPNWPALLTFEALLLAAALLLWLVGRMIRHLTVSHAGRYRIERWTARARDWSAAGRRAGIGAGATLGRALRALSQSTLR